MAIVTAPLLSVTARKSFGKTMVYMRRRGQNIVRQHVVPSNPQTPAQEEQRELFRNCANLYNSAYYGIRAGLRAYAAELGNGKTPNGEYMRRNIRNLMSVKDNHDTAIYPVYLSFEGPNTFEIAMAAIPASWGPTWTPSSADVHVTMYDDNNNIVQNQTFAIEFDGGEGDATGTGAKSMVITGGLHEDTAKVRFWVTNIVSNLGDPAVMPYDFVFGPVQPIELA